MSFPFLFLAFSLAGGILFAAALNPPDILSVILFLLAFGLTWTFHLRKKIKLSFLLILAATFLLGSSLYRVSDSAFEKNTLRRFQADSYADFSGTVCRSVSPGRNGDTLYMKVKTVSHHGREEKVQGRLQVTVARSSPASNPLRLFVGDKVKLAAQLISPKSYQNFNPPSGERWQKAQRIHHRAFTKSPLLVQKIEPGSNLSPLRLISMLRQELIEKIEAFFISSAEAPSLSAEGGVLEALLLGERGRMDDQLTLDLQKAGLYHLFAISGAHVALLSFVLFSVFKLLRISTRLSSLILMVLLVFYALLVEGRPSIFRATIMTLFFLGGKLIWKETNLLNTVSFAAFVLLLFNPFSLSDPGFQLTFTATLAIILFFPKMKKILPKLPLRISEILAISTTAQLGVLPIMARLFNRVTFSSLLLNFAALPLVAVIMLSGYLFLCLAFFSALLSSWLAAGLSAVISILVSLSNVLDRVTFLSFRIPTPHLAIIAGYYLFSSLLLLPQKKRQWKWPLRAAFLVAFGLIVIHPFPSVSKDLKFTFIDVGQGDSILIEFPGKKKMLVDGGGLPASDFSIGEYVVSPFLWNKGIKSLDFMVLTHAHPDHMNGLLPVAQNFRIGEFWESLSPYDNTDYQKLQKALNDSTIRRRIYRGQNFVVDGVRIDILHPLKRELPALSIDNEQSAVLRFSYGQTAFLLAADIGVTTELDILASGFEVRSDVLKSPHHGSRSSSSAEFLQEVKPRFAVISIGERNQYGLPDDEVLARYAESGVKILRTDLLGAVQISSNGQSLSVRTAVDHLK